MVTREQLHEHLGRRPFRPFRVMLLNGESLDVVRVAQAVASRTTFIFGTPQDRFRHVPLTQIDHIETVEFRKAAS